MFLRTANATDALVGIDVQYLAIIIGDEIHYYLVLMY